MPVPEDTMFYEFGGSELPFHSVQRDLNEVLILALILVSFALVCLIYLLVICLCEPNEKYDQKNCVACTDASYV